jgi:hypothetical protein
MVRTGVDGHLEHAIAYAGTAFLFEMGYPDWGRKRPAAGLVIYAAVLEGLQTFSPGRHPAGGRGCRPEAAVLACRHGKEQDSSGENK